MFAAAIRTSMETGTTAHERMNEAVSQIKHDKSATSQLEQLLPSTRKRPLDDIKDGAAKRPKLSSSEATVPRKWQAWEDEALTKSAVTYGGKQWKHIAANVPGRNHAQCLQRWKKLLKKRQGKQENAKPAPKKESKISGHALSGLTVPRKWSEKEDAALKVAVEFCNGKQWKKIATMVPGRNHIQCLQRWKKVLAPGLVKGTWTAEEDELLKKLYHSERNVILGRTRKKSATSQKGIVMTSTGTSGGKTHEMLDLEESSMKDPRAALEIQTQLNWGSLATHVEGRTAKQCRERWCNHLDPSIKRGNWTAEEDRYLLTRQSKLGNKWTKISVTMDGRTENAVKIRWKSLQRDDKGDKLGVKPFVASAKRGNTSITKPIEQKAYFKSNVESSDDRFSASALVEERGVQQSSFFYQ